MAANPDIATPVGGIHDVQIASGAGKHSVPAFAFLRIRPFSADEFVEALRFLTWRGCLRLVRFAFTVFPMP